MLNLKGLPDSLKMMGFTSSYFVDFWAARIAVPAVYAPVLRQAIATSARKLPLYRISGYFLNDLAEQDGQIAYQINRIPGPPQETLSDQALNQQLTVLLEQLKRDGVPYEYQSLFAPPQEERFCLLFGLGKGFSGIHFSGEQVWEVLQQQRAWQGTYQKVTIYAVGGGEEAYEEPALLVSCLDEADLHWLCMALLVFWQEWATVYDKQELVTYRLVTALEDLRELLYTDPQKEDG